MEPDFSGWATKYNKKCTDGLTILPGAFQHDNEKQLPLVWKHDDSTPGNVLGHVKLTHKNEGVWVDGFFNKSKGASDSRELLEHGDIKSMSIHAREVVKRVKDVIHGAIKEVSLVTAGANPGATIEKVYFKHGDDFTEELEDEMIIHSGEEIQIGKSKQSDKTEDIEHADDDNSGKSVKEIYDAMSKEQQTVLHYMVGEAIASEEDDGDDDGDTTQNDNSDSLNHEGTAMTKRNIFEHNGDAPKGGDTLTHSDLGGDDVSEILHAMAAVGTARNYIKHADTTAYGVQNLDLLFPDARTIDAMPEVMRNRNEWVSGVLGGIRATPFTRVKSIHADMTSDEAIAKGYIKSTQKVDQVFPIMARTTGPKTVYNRQKMDRDDILDVTDFDIVVWIKAEMRLQLEETMAEAILIGDGRPVDHPDKIRDPAGAASGDGIRSILKDSDFYSDKVLVAEDLKGEELIETVARSRRRMRGSGRPTFYTTEDVLNDMLFSRDAEGRRRYNSEAEVATALRVDKVVVVDPMERITTLVGIVVNLGDYSLGTDKGGKTTFFDDFDIDFNQYKYLLETRVAGGLTRWLSAQVFSTVASVAGNLPTPDGTSPHGDQAPEVIQAGYLEAEAAARARGYAGQPIEETTP